MKLTFCGGAQTVTGSSFLLEAAGQKDTVGLWYVSGQQAFTGPQ